MSSRTWNQLAWMAITALVVLVFAQVMTFEFVNWDDLNHLSHPDMTEASWDHFFGLWRRSYYNFYIPVAYSVWFLVGAVEGLLAGRPGQMVFDPSHFHGLNLVLHLLNAGLVFAFLRKILLLQKRSDDIVRWGSFFGAAVFAIHPLQVETVAWVSGLRDLLACTFSLLTLHLMLPSEMGRERSIGSLISATCMFSLALLSKPSAIVVPIAFFLVDYAWLRKQRQGRTNWRVAPLIILAIVFAGLTAWLQSSADMDFIPPLWSGPFIALDTMGFYALKLVAPWPLIPDYGRNPKYLIETGQIYWTWLVTALGFAVLLYQLRKSQILFAVLMVLIALLPTSGLLAFRFQDVSTVADHYLYFPMVFIVLAGALWMGSAKLGRVAAVLFILSCAAYSLMQTQHWKNSEFLSTWELAENPQSFSFLNSRADFYARSGDCQTALGLY